MALFALIASLDNDDQTKVMAIYRRLYNRLYNYTYSRLGSREDTEDVVQTVFEHIIRDLDKIDAVDSPRTSGLLFLITKRVIIKKQGERHKHAALPIDAADPDAQTEADDPVWDAVALGLSLEQLAQCLRALPEEDYLLMVWRHLHHCSYRELAARLGTSEKNVSVRLSRLRRRIQQMVQGEEVAGYGAQGNA